MAATPRHGTESLCFGVLGVCSVLVPELLQGVTGMNFATGRVYHLAVTLPFALSLALFCALPLLFRTSPALLFQRLVGSLVGSVLCLASVVLAFQFADSLGVWVFPVIMVLGGGSTALLVSSVWSLASCSVNRRESIMTFLTATFLGAEVWPFFALVYTARNVVMSRAGFCVAGIIACILSIPAAVYLGKYCPGIVSPASAVSAESQALLGQPAPVAPQPGQPRLLSSVGVALRQCRWAVLAVFLVSLVDKVGLSWNNWTLMLRTVGDYQAFPLLISALAFILPATVGAALGLSGSLAHALWKKKPTCAVLSLGRVLLLVIICLSFLRGMRSSVILVSIIFMLLLGATAGLLLVASACLGLPDTLSGPELPASGSLLSCGYLLAQVVGLGVLSSFHWRVATAPL